jgi:hypothetical protein
MELEDGRTAGNMSFQALWSTGQLDKKFYEGFKAESGGTYNTDWMFEKENRSLGTKLKAMYDTDVIESRHKDMFKAKEESVASKKSNKKASELFGQYTDSGGDYELGIKPIASIPRGDKEDRYRSLLALDGFSGIHYAYEWNGSTWEAYSLDGKKEKVKDLNGGQVARIEGLKTINESVFDDFIISSEELEEKKEKTPSTPGTLSLGDIKVDKTKDIVNNFSKIFKPDLFQNYDFEVVLDDYNDLTKLQITPKRKGLPKVPVFTIGDEATEEIAGKITKLFEDYLLIDKSYEDKD